MIPEEDDFKIRNEKDSYSYKNGKIETAENSQNIVDKPEIALSNEHLRKEFKLKILQKTYDSETIEWLFNVIRLRKNYQKKYFVFYSFILNIFAYLNNLC